MKIVSKTTLKFQDEQHLKEYVASLGKEVRERWQAAIENPGLEIDSVKFKRADKLDASTTVTFLEQ